MDNLRGLAALGEDARLATQVEPVDKADEVGKRIRAAREAAGVSGTKLGSYLGLGRDQISKIENGRRRVSLGELAVAAEALGTSVRVLLGMPERPHLALAARLATGAGNEVMTGPRKRARQILEIDDLMTRAVGLPPSRPSDVGARVLEEARTLSRSSLRGVAAARRQGEELAELLRQELALGQDGIRELPSLCEQHFAVDVALAPWGEDADGLCVHSGDAALILASTDFSAGHQRFTIAHELGHHFFADPREVIDERAADMFSDELVEKRASAFAGHLLMPRPGVESLLSDWLGERPNHVSDRSLVVLMSHFGVSFAALIFQLVLLNWMTFDDGQERKARRREILFRHRDAMSAMPNEGQGLRRAPERLVRHATKAAQEYRLGITILATLLEREDDDQLWQEVVGASDEVRPTGSVGRAALSDDEIEL